ncbi:splicing factor U2AF 35 kDa subunit-like isoform X3 [Eriocheir sinensis]|uniref:splicing factor U2AF 35 kDa subunit-like isoform X3 n=1 Tax=Eriocheir sinensis TaxID=95602 RepID=UPI0021C99E27|nr:splicing factor U2AF 35 kDa subunit-like isoform X3 [Eriocheir sinensis]
MAEYLASIFGTEKDKVNCSFYFKIGACRHGDRCSRIHNKPTFSQCVPDMHYAIFYLLPGDRQRLCLSSTCTAIPKTQPSLQTAPTFKYEEDAERAVVDLNNRWFGGRAINAELSPVTDFREACCRQYEMGECTRSGFCNFMHLKPISRELRRELYSRKRRRLQMKSKLIVKVVTDWTATSFGLFPVHPRNWPHHVTSSTSILCSSLMSCNTNFIPSSLNSKINMD